MRLNVLKNSTQLVILSVKRLNPVNVGNKNFGMNTCIVVNAAEHSCVQLYSCYQHAEAHLLYVYIEEIIEQSRVIIFRLQCQLALLCLCYYSLTIIVVNETESCDLCYCRRCYCVFVISRLQLWL